MTMNEFLRALEHGRVREVFGSGTACQVCPVHRILYQGKVRWGPPGAKKERRRGRGHPPHGPFSPSSSTFPPWKMGLS